MLKFNLPFDYDEHHVYTLAELQAKPRIFQIIALNAIRREGFYTYTAIRENAPEVRILVTLNDKE